MTLTYILSGLIIVALIATGAFFLLRTKPYSSKGLVLRGAINSIMDGTAHPETQRFLVPIPGLKLSAPKASKQAEHQASAGDNAVTQVSAIAQPNADAPKASADTTPPKTDPAKAVVPKNIFREYDIRGLVDTELTPSLMKKIGAAVGTMVERQGRKEFVVGSDNRLSGGKLLEGLVKGIASSGLKITNVGIVPTPVLYYSIHKHSIPDGIMLTGSHNDYAYNGCKIVINGAPLKSGEIQKIYNSIMSNDYVRGKGSLSTTNPFSSYVTDLLQVFAEVKPNFHVAVDCAHGVTGAYIPFVLRKLGCKVTELACGLDQNQATHAPDPTVASHLENLQSTIRDATEKIDFGLAYDGDGDRMVVVDDTGNIIWPDKILMLFAKYALEKNPGGTVVYDVKCSGALGPWIKQHGGKPLMWKTGHSLIRHKMHEEDAVLAGELSGHIFWREWHSFDDAIFSSCRLIQILSESGQKLSEISSGMPGGHASPELRVPMQNDSQAKEIVEQVRQLCADHPANIVDIDGLRFEYDDRWGLIRPSNTSPVLVCRFEGDDAEKLGTIQEEIKGLLHQVDPSLQIPF